MGVRPVADEPVAVEVAQAHLAARGELGVARDDRDVRVAQQLEHLERPVVDREDAEGEVELPGLDLVEEDGVVLLVERHVEERPVRREAAQERGQHLRADRLEGADAERPALAGRERVEVGARGLHARHDPARVAQEELAGRRHRHGPRPAGAREQLLADDLLERRDLLADGRLGVAEPLRGAAEGALLGDCLKGREVA